MMLGTSIKKESKRKCTPPCNSTWKQTITSFKAGEFFKHSYETKRKLTLPQKVGYTRSYSSCWHRVNESQICMAAFYMISSSWATGQEEKFLAFRFMQSEEEMVSRGIESRLDTLVLTVIAYVALRKRANFPL